MNENSENLEGLTKETSGVFDFEQSVGEVKNFGQLYKLINKLPNDFVGKDNAHYSSEELIEIVKEAIEETKLKSEIRVSRLSEVSDALERKFPELIEQWCKDNAALELDA